MQDLPLDRKLYLLAQNRQMQSQRQLTQPSIPSNKFASHGPSSAPSFLPKLVPQLAGRPDSVIKRFSIPTFTGWGGGSSNDEEDSLDVNSNESRPHSSLSSLSVSQPVVPQTTGGLFGSWWNRSPSVQPLRPDLTGGPDTLQDPSWYISEISNL
jgi:diaphanous 1